MVGIRDIADHLNISVASVSRALNGHPYVSEALRTSIALAAHELGYQPKQSGRSLRTGMSNTVGFMIETHPTNPKHVDNFLSSILDAVQNVMRRRGLTLVALPCSANQDPAEYIREIIARRFIDGMILTSTRPADGRVSEMKSAGLPFVTLGRTSRADKHTWIDLDFENFVDEAMGRLYARGHRRIAIMLPKESLNFGHITLAGYKKWHRKIGLPFNPELVVSITPDPSSGYSACELLLSRENPPTASILIHEALATGVYDCLRSKGFTPGVDFGLISLNDSVGVRLSPELTKFKFDSQKIGVTLAELLLFEMDGQVKPSKHKHKHKHKQTLVPFEILEGQSEGFNRAAD